MNKTPMLILVSLLLIGFAQACHCGDGSVNVIGEQCDWGSDNGETCTPLYGDSCKYCSESCQWITLQGDYCGDGDLQNSYEECDDGNNINGDGCSSTCTIEEQNTFCGDQICNGDENCSNCEIDCGTCPTPDPVCGDGECNGEETCSSCKTDCGSCPDPDPVCGNNIQETGEECDWGLNNGQVCDNSSSSCEYCNSECNLITLNYNYEDDDEGSSHKNKISFSFCEPNWECSGWSKCINGFRTRECYDINYCSEYYNLPIEKTSCPIISKVYEEEPFNFPWIILIIFIILILLIFIINKIKII